jgi:biotin carboxylase
MRKCARDIGVLVPDSYCVSSLSEAYEIIKNTDSFFYPIMIKPVDSSASRGVFKINSDYDLSEKFDVSLKYSKCKKSNY